jgi:hypothetical protein
VTRNEELADDEGLDALADWRRDQERDEEWARDEAEAYYLELRVATEELHQGVKVALAGRFTAQPRPELLRLEAEATAFIAAEGWQASNPGEAFCIGEEGWEPHTDLERELTALEADLRRLRHRLGIARALNVAKLAQWRRRMAASLSGAARSQVVEHAHRVARPVTSVPPTRNPVSASSSGGHRRRGPRSRRRHNPALSRPGRSGGKGDHVAPVLRFRGRVTRAS